MNEKKIDEKRRQIKEMNYLRSLNLLDLATELRLAEKRVRRFKESGEELKLERAKEYRDKLKKKINGRLESMESSQDE